MKLGSCLHLEESKGQSGQQSSGLTYIYGPKTLQSSVDFRVYALF